MIDQSLLTLLSDQNFCYTGLFGPSARVSNTYFGVAMPSSNNLTVSCKLKSTCPFPFDKFSSFFECIVLTFFLCMKYCNSCE